MIELDDLRIASARRRRSPAARAVAADIRDQVAELERHAIVDALEACGGNQTEAAKRLGHQRRALIYRMEKHGLKPPPASRVQD